MASKVQTEHRPFVLPPRSLRNPKLTNAKIAAEGHCRMCLRPHAVRRLTRHHLIEVAWFVRQPGLLRSYRNAWANIVPVCRDDHDLLHSKDKDEQTQARRMLRRALTQQEISFVIAVRGKAWLDRSYPPL